MAFSGIKIAKKNAMKSPKFLKSLYNVVISLLETAFAIKGDPWLKTILTIKFIILVSLN